MTSSPSSPHGYTIRILLFCAIYASATAAQIPEPFPPISGKPTGRPIPLSPDPLARYQWDPSTDFSQLQIYTVSKVPLSGIHASPSKAFINLKSLAEEKQKTDVRVKGPATLRLDYGVEHAAWLEVSSPDLCPVLSKVQASISEYNEPFVGKTHTLVSYGNCTEFRLEPNKELYEGVRFAWIFVGEGASFSMTDIRLVAQVKPMNYSASFQSSDAALTKSWYTGAYAARLNTMGCV